MTAAEQAEIIAGNLRTCSAATEKIDPLTVAVFGLPADAVKGSQGQT